MKFMKKAVAALICVSAIFSLTACSDTTWALSYDGSEIPAGVYIANQISAYSEASSKVEDTSADLFKQTIEDKTAEQWINDETIVLCNKYTAIEQKFDELNLVLTDADKAQIDQATDVQWAYYGALYEKNGISKDSYRLLIQNSKKSELIFHAYYDEGGIEPVIADDLRDAFFNDYVKANYFGMTYASALTDGEEDTADENEKMDKLAAEWVEKINNKEMTFGEVRDAYGHYIDGSDHDPDNKNDVISVDSETLKFYTKDASELPFDEKGMDVLFNDMKADGTARLITETDEDGTTPIALYLAVKYEITEDDFTEHKDTILSDEKGEEFTQKITEWAQKLTPEQNAGAIKRYSPKKLKLS